MTKKQTYLNYIDGQWSPSLSGKLTPSINPANREEIVGYVQDSAGPDLELAVSAANRAKGAWRKLSGAARGDYLFKAANLLEARLEDIAETMMLEMGKTFAECKGETARGVAILRYYAGEGMRKTGDVIPSTDHEAMMFTMRVPLGVVGVITPWNFPVAIPMWKMAPALIYGNTVVIKPAIETSITAAKLLACFDEAGFPPGVVNMVTGDGEVIGGGIARHADIQGITFTGSNKVGKQIGQTALARGAKYQLEMGGKNPLIVAEDANLDLAVDAAITGGLKSTGQKCTATSRVLVHASIYETFRAKLLDRVQQLKLGNGNDASTWMGPCANEKQRNTVLSYINKGIEEGASLLFGGGIPDNEDLKNGYYVQPTVFDNVTSSMTIAKEEIFGPVLALMPFDNLEEALSLANDVEYGLSASIFTQNISYILTFIADMDAGLVRINAETAGVELQAPFGGMKQSSSHSREQGQAAIEFFTSIKTVFLKG
ncbi:putative aldehyde dehydrogenase YcbD [Paenibacillus baekrokdamisoli]|uniref:Putative aldehyde dehydrogenase YcbD n=1 Tax=Paenibacillus baekrokdamisoli TaxID=1712516 RepID=A0A3G9ISZ0_9BACL|nr:alpha-ketoglutaric semialdehyde dehydrogenase GucD [Paenibacillus baekrokdamisoli]MBB3067669.1 aldehyde dehydrogenase (NAD+) [Paenibacillus baekrokdamisoli]BBH19145.1 putative aldehyde dehydrogenase YcbD [Paenibacillus baekrokdamisoli]